MSREGNLLWSIGLAMALTGVAAVTAVVDQKPQPMAHMASVGSQPPTLAQLGRPRVTGLGD